MNKKVRKIKTIIHKVLIIIAFCIPIISFEDEEYRKKYGFSHREIEL